MDSLRLLSRSTKPSRHASAQKTKITPSAGPNEQLQLSSPNNEISTSTLTAGKPTKRKRGFDAPADQTAELDFFGKKSAKVARSAEEELDKGDALQSEDVLDAISQSLASDMPLDVRKHVLKQHKLKVTWVNPPPVPAKERRQGTTKKSSKAVKEVKPDKLPIFPRPMQSFTDMRAVYKIPSQVASNVEEQGYTAPTEVQLGAIPLLLEKPQDLLSPASTSSPDYQGQDVDLLTVAPTGSGKTLAFAIPLLHRILQRRKKLKSRPRCTSAIILAPTKELASQITNECRKLARLTGIKVTHVRKGMKLAETNANPEPVQDDGDVCEGDDHAESSETVVKSDILVATPGLLSSMIQEAKTAAQVLADVRHLILDEADVLLDPLFREQTLAIWNGLLHVDMRVSLWSATMGSNIEELAVSVINARRGMLVQQGSKAEEAALLRLVVGLKDSAVSNIEHRLVYAASEQGKLMGLRQLLHPATSSAENGPPLLPPFLVFTQTIERAIALHSELLYDIPAEAGGISRIAVLHSDLSDTARDTVMTRFRKGEIWVLITTDLLSRGVDFRRVNGVVNYDIPTSSAAYVHRVGRTGRAGREGGVAVTLYSKDDIPYLKHVANVVATAQKQKGSAGGDGREGVQQWLLDALPSLSKKSKQDLKKHGVGSRNAHEMKKDPKAAKRARISTKAGYIRKEEHRRKGAIMGSRRRLEETQNEAGEETDFGGFD